MTNVNQSPFEWTPGAELDKQAMSDLFDLVSTRPRKAPGEAWFMSAKRERFSLFIECPTAEIPTKYVQNCLFEITSGLTSFSGCTEEVEHWKLWYRHLLPYLVERAHDCYVDYLIEALITGFMQIYQDNPDQEFQGFRLLALETIGKAIMKPEFWSAGVPVWAKSHDWWRVDKLPRAAYCSGALSASMFFCLIYLRPSDIASWTKSVLNIESTYFRAHLLAWLVGAQPWLVEPRRRFGQLDKADIKIDWASYFLLKHPSLVVPADSANELLKALRAELSEERALTWIDEIWKVNDLSEPFQYTGIGERVFSEVLRAP